MRKYSAVLLPNWVCIDLTKPIKEPLKAAVAQMIDQVPADSAKRVAGYVQKRLSEMLNKLASRGAVAVYMPAENPAVASAFPVFSVRPAEFVVDGEPMEPMDYLVALVGGGAAGLIEPEGMVGVRWATDHETTDALREELASAPADIAGGLDTEARDRVVRQGRMSREIEYIIGVPQSEDRWMAISASLSVIRDEGSDELLDAVTNFADRWVETITWEEGDGDV